MLVHFWKFGHKPFYFNDAIDKVGVAAVHVLEYLFSCFTLNAKKNALLEYLLIFIIKMLQHNELLMQQ